MLEHQHTRRSAGHSLLSSMHANIDTNLLNEPIVDLLPFGSGIDKLDAERPKKLRQKLPNFRSSNLAQVQKLA